MHDGFYNNSQPDINAVIVNQFRKLFISYSNSMNSPYDLHGGMFSTPFRRIVITIDSSYSQIIYYIQYNAVHHRICNHPSDYLKGLHF